MHLEELVDQMIDRAKEHDLLNTYSILLGTDPTKDGAWVRGKRVYRWFPVAQTSLVPNDVIVLAPSPDNYQTGDLVEFRGHLGTMAITEHPVRLHATAPADTEAIHVAPTEERSQ